MNNFLLTYNAQNANFSPNNLLTFIKSHRLIEQWCVPFSGTYFIKSAGTVMELHLSIYEFFIETEYFISQVTPLTTAGLAPDDIWNWFNRSVMPDEQVAYLSANRKIPDLNTDKKFSGQ